MLGSKTVLIVDESGYAALDLSEAIVESDGCVAGPAATLFSRLWCESLSIGILSTKLSVVPSSRCLIPHATSLQISL